MKNVMEKTCLQCGQQVKGRSDKKFCNDWCRNSFNNRVRNDDSPYVKQVNQVLRRNRRLLEALIPPNQETAKVHRSRLADQGFNFRFHTHLFTNKKGSQYHFCYEYGYLTLEGDWLFVVRRKE